MTSDIQNFQVLLFDSLLNSECSSSAAYVYFPFYGLCYHLSPENEGSVRFLGHLFCQSENVEDIPFCSEEHNASLGALSLSYLFLHMNCTSVHVQLRKYSPLHHFASLAAQRQ